MKRLFAVPSLALDLLKPSFQWLEQSARKILYFKLAISRTGNETRR